MEAEKPMIIEVSFTERDTPVEVPGDVVPVSWQFHGAYAPPETPYVYRRLGDPLQTLRCNVRGVTMRGVALDVLALRPAGAPPGARLVGAGKGVR
jgi:hypothetical protein